MTTQFTTRNVDINGTSLQGYITCSYDVLEQIFGKSIDGDGYKTRAEWEGKTSDGTVFSIYDWKESQSVYDVTNWHIGGRDRRAVEAVHDIVRERLGDLSKYAVRFDQLRWF